MTDAWDDEDRAIARALGVDAPPGAEADAQAVSDYEAVLGALPFEPVAPRPELEHEVVAAALARRPAAARAIDSAPSRARRSMSARWVAIAATAAAAAAVAAVLAVGGSDSGPGGPGGSIARAASTVSVGQVVAAPGTRAAVLRTSNQAGAGRVALGKDGQGFLYDLAPAAGGQVRWLWLDTAAGPVRVGKLPDATPVHFVVRGDIDAVKGVLVTAEQGTPVAPGVLLSNATLPPAG